jgi:hypothetical protein
MAQIAGRSAGAFRSTTNDMLCYPKANMGIDGSPLAAAETRATAAPQNEQNHSHRADLHGDR